ncbi:CYBB, partial [Symbiodinium sp. CCMP2456]
VPQGFVYQAGQYILLGWKGEWHPFTLTSAPEENCISVHIRAASNLDWCSALRKRLTEEAPAQAKGEPMSEKPPKAPKIFEYSDKVLPNSHIVYNVPADQGADKLKEIAGQVSPPALPTGASEPEGKPSKLREGDPALRSGVSLLSSPPASLLPPEAVMLQVTGPFGAPAQKVWSFDTLMAVGAGIGVTPFASIMRSVQLRAKQRETLLRGGGSGEKATSTMVQKMIPIPKKIYFYWICRGQEEFDWFYDLLSAAAEGPAAGVVEITLFLTGEIELQQVKKLPCASGQFFGRPNWGRIFKQNREKHQGEHIGVFLCGSPIIGEELGRQSVKNSDVIGTPGGTRFSFFKEHF